MALGAQISDVRRRVLRDGFVFASSAVEIGLGAAVVTTPLLSSLLYGVTPMVRCPYFEEVFEITPAFT
jgi:hypothetical protein